MAEVTLFAGHPTPAHGDRSGVVGVDAGDSAQHLGASGPDETCDAQDLTGVDLQVDVGEGALGGEPLNVEDHIPRVGGPAGELLGDVAAHHHADQFRFGGLCGDGVDVLAIADDGDGVADRRDLIEMVRDEGHGDALGP